MLKKLLIIIALFPCFAYGEESVISTTRFESALDENNQKVQIVEQVITLKTASIHTIPRLGYVHEMSYGISINSDFNSGPESTELNNFTKIFTTHMGSVLIYGLRTTYVYDGGYDFKGNDFHDFEFDVRKELPISEVIKTYIDAGYFHEQRVITISAVQYAINNRDLFYKVGLYYTRPNYKIGFHFKNAYDSSFDWKMTTLALYSVFNF